MIRKNEVSKALDGAFRAAFMLTGCTQAAEHAVLDGIAATEFDNVKCYEQGAVLGLNQSLQSVAQILAPLASTFLIGRRPARSLGLVPGRHLHAWPMALRADAAGSAGANELTVMIIVITNKFWAEQPSYTWR